MPDIKKVTILKNGPYRVSGAIPLMKETAVVESGSYPVSWEKEGTIHTAKTYSLCRCGSSKTKPFCDGTHASIEFDGTETATRDSFDQQAHTIEGKGLAMKDVKVLCSGARFCDRDLGAWELVKHSHDPACKRLATQQATDCPSGRLVVIDKETGKPIEPDFEPSIAVTDDPGARVSGPLWVRGGIPIETADGLQYEIRNRVTLCRCGKSNNKPFCDGTHIEVKFSDRNE